MAFCTTCGSEIKESSAFCTSCGAPVLEKEYGATEPAGDKRLEGHAAGAMGSPEASEAICASCGAALSAESAFCTSCGAGIGTEGSRTPAKEVAASSQAAVAASEKGKGGKGLVIGIIVAVIVLIAAIGVIILVATGAFDAAVEGEGKRPIEQSAVSSSAESSASSVSSSGSSSSSAAASSSSKASERGPYILPESASRYYTSAELGALSDWELYVARNEIYARHGRGFNNQDLADYFSRQPWYSELYEPAQFDSMPSPLNDYERKNADLIRSVEQSRGSSYL